MSNQFNFPPPPPPPPQTFSNYPTNIDRPPGGFADRGPRGSSGFRGRGRGNSRGSSRGGYGGKPSHASSYGGHPQGDASQADQRYGHINGYGADAYQVPNYAPVQHAQYPMSAYNAYQPQYSQPHPPQQNPIPPYAPYPAYTPNAYTPNGHADSPHLHGRPQQAFGYAPHEHSRQSTMQHHPNQPMMMGPPIHIGPDGRPTGQTSPPHSFAGPAEVNRLPLGNNTRSTRHDSPNPFPGRGRKRNRTEAFRKTHDDQQKSKVAPAVPSFGSALPVDLPVKPPVPEPKKKRKKKRRYNQLGLTPKTEEHESSDEEDDQDEEAKLAAAAGGEPQQLQFTYRGRTSTLQSPSEIAAWIAERKKKFPTKARAAEAAERKRKHDEERQAARQAAIELQAKRRAEARIKHEEEKAAKERQRGDKEKSPGEGAADGASGDAKALRAKARVEKLRRRLEKEERRVAKALKSKPETKAQAETSGPPVEQTESGPFQETGHSATSDVVDSATSMALDSQISNSMQDVVKSSDGTATQTGPQEHDASIDASTVTDKASADAISIANPLTPTSQYSVPDQERVPVALEGSTEELPDTVSAEPVANMQNHNSPSKLEGNHEESDLSMSTTSSDISSSSEDDDTSSEGTSSSSDDAPKVATSKRTAPDKVPPAKREKAKSSDICRSFLKCGRCPRRDRCRYRHERPEKGTKLKTARSSKGELIKKERKSLYQRLVEQEQQEEDEQILDTIIELGNRGLLAEPAQQESNDAAAEPK
ncbi:MAG: hypothetical protein Q9191_003415 [Dirinaria sp. TL-2023a]